MSKQDIGTYIDNLKQGIKLSEKNIKSICDKAKQIFQQQPNVVKVQSPVTICGDIHGQFEDLLELFKIGGQLPFVNYIFMGDYVDRGYNSLQVFLLLMCLKIKYRHRITILRGNHQSQTLTKMYGFYEECLKKYGSLNVWIYCTNVFQFLNLSAVVDGKIFCVHGGLSPSIKRIDEINQIQRVGQISAKGAMSDLMWSDPQNSIQGWVESNRGAGYLFGKQKVFQFQHNNNLSLIARAHQLAQEGYNYMFNQKLITVWSAPNYMYKMGNVASVLQFDENLQKQHKVFEAAPYQIKNTERQVPLYFL